jgi:hypothetical protein
VVSNSGRNIFALSALSKKFIEFGSTAPLALRITPEDKALHHHLFGTNYKPVLM